MGGEKNRYLVMILIGISQIISEVGHLFICLLAIWAAAAAASVS